jgi:hypothetical protein
MDGGFRTCSLALSGALKMYQFVNGLAHRPPFFRRKTGLFSAPV